MTTSRQTRPPRAALLLLAVLAPLPVLAQYKVVAPDGSVTYTDRPSVPSTHKVQPLARGGAVVSPVSNPALPPELRTPVLRFPVTLYTARDCPPCDSGRLLLSQRGIPYTERLVVTDDDVVALERAVGWRTVPTMVIGSQTLRGLAADEWTSYIDLAGYPKESKLPRGWQQAAATPLTTPVSNPLPTPQPPPPAAEPQTPPRPPGSIRF